MNPNIYDALCKVLSDRAGQVDWGAFTAADWDHFAQRAVAEGVGPLIHWTLKGSDEPSFTPAALPPSAVQTLAEAYYQSAAHNALLFKELERILAALGDAGIPVIVLKGAALAHTLYPDLALRPMNDLDLLVKPDDLWAANRAIQNLGYTQEKITYHACLRGGPDQQVAVEIHWSVVPDGKGRSPSLAWFFSQAEPFLSKNNCYSALQLTPAAQFVYLCGHLFLQTESSDRRLVWFYGLYRLYRQYAQSLNWAALWRHEATACWSAWLSAAFYLLRDLFGLQPPAHLTGLAQATALPDQDTRAITREHIWSAWRQLNTRSRILVIAGFAFPHKKYLVWRYQIKHPWLWPFFLPRRWWEIFNSPKQY